MFEMYYRTLMQLCLQLLVYISLKLAASILVFMVNVSKNRKGLGWFDVGSY